MQMRRPISPPAESRPLGDGQFSAGSGRLGQSRLQRATRPPSSTSRPVFPAARKGISCTDIGVSGREEPAVACAFALATASFSSRARASASSSTRTEGDNDDYDSRTAVVEPSAANSPQSRLRSRRELDAGSVRLSRSSDTGAILRRAFRRRTPSRPSGAGSTLTPGCTASIRRPPRARPGPVRARRGPGCPPASAGGRGARLARRAVHRGRDRIGRVRGWNIVYASSSLAGADSITNEAELCRRPRPSRRPRRSRGRRRRRRGGDRNLAGLDPAQRGRARGHAARPARRLPDPGAGRAQRLRDDRLGSGRGGASARSSTLRAARSSCASRSRTTRPTTPK